MFSQRRDDYDQGFEYSAIGLDLLKELLVGRRIVEVKDEGCDNSGLVLDNGVTLYVVPNEGCSGCTAGRWWIERIDKADSAITDVRWDEKTFNYDENHEEDCDIRVKIFVYTESDVEAKEILTLEGYEDNGFYGEGFELCLVSMETEAKTRRRDAGGDKRST